MNEPSQLKLEDLNREQQISIAKHFLQTVLPELLKSIISIESEIYSHAGPERIDGTRSGTDGLQELKAVKQLARSKILQALAMDKEQAVRAEELYILASAYHNDRCHVPEGKLYDLTCAYCMAVHTRGNLQKNKDLLVDGLFDLHTFIQIVRRFPEEFKLTVLTPEKSFEFCAMIKSLRDFPRAIEWLEQQIARYSREKYDRTSSQSISDAQLKKIKLLNLLLQEIMFFINKNQWDEANAKEFSQRLRNFLDENNRDILSVEGISKYVEILKSVSIAITSEAAFNEYRDPATIDDEIALRQLLSKVEASNAILASALAQANLRREMDAYVSETTFQNVQSLSVATVVFPLPSMHTASLNEIYIDQVNLWLKEQISLAASAAVSGGKLSVTVSTNEGQQKFLLELKRRGINIKHLKFEMDEVTLDIDILQSKAGPSTSQTKPAAIDAAASSAQLFKPANEAKDAVKRLNDLLRKRFPGTLVLTRGDQIFLIMPKTYQTAFLGMVNLPELGQFNEKLTLQLPHGVLDTIYSCCEAAPMRAGVSRKQQLNI